MSTLRITVAHNHSRECQCDVPIHGVLLSKCANVSFMPDLLMSWRHRSQCSNDHNTSHMLVITRLRGSQSPSGGLREEHCQERRALAGAAVLHGQGCRFIVGVGSRNSSTNAAVGRERLPHPTIRRGPTSFVFSGSARHPTSSWLGACYV